MSQRKSDSSPLELSRALNPDLFLSICVDRREHYVSTKILLTEEILLVLSKWLVGVNKLKIDMMWFLVAHCKSGHFIFCTSSSLCSTDNLFFFSHDLIFFFLFPKKKNTHMDLSILWYSIMGTQHALQVEVYVVCVSIIIATTHFSLLYRAPLYFGLFEYMYIFVIALSVQLK